MINLSQQLKVLKNSNEITVVKFNKSHKYTFYGLEDWIESYRFHKSNFKIKEENMFETDKYPSLNLDVREIVKGGT